MSRHFEKESTPCVQTTLALVLLGCLLLSGFFTPADARTGGSEASAELISFELEDQFGKTLSAEDLEGRPVLVIAADGSASDFTGAWSAALGDVIARLGLEDQVEVLGLADLCGVPSFMRERVRESFSTDPKDAALLDWKGDFAMAYDFEKRYCNLLLFGADGAVAQQAAVRELDDGVLDAFETALSHFQQP